MTHFRMRMPLIVATVVAASILGVPGKVRADFEVEISTDGGTTFNTVYSSINNSTYQPGMGGPPGLGLEFSTFTVAASSSPGATTLDIGITGMVSSNFIIEATVTGINTAPPPQNFLAVFSNSSPFGNVAMSTFVDYSNTPFGTNGLNYLGSPDDDSNSQALASSPGVSSTLSIPNVFSANPPYSLTTVVSVTNRNLDFPFVQFDNNNSISPFISPTPAPGGMLLALTGLPLLFFRKRWNQKSSTTTTLTLGVGEVSPANL